MNIVYKYPLRISKTNTSTLYQWTCTCRYLYNRTLRLKKRCWEHFSYNWKYLGDQGMSARLKILRHRYQWIKDTPFPFEQQTLRNLDVAFKIFFKRHKDKKPGGFPKFKHKNQFPGLYIAYAKINIIDGKHYLKIPKLKQDIRIQLNRPYLESAEDKLKSATITYNKANNQWYVCLLVEKPDKNYSIINTNPHIGVDLGIRQTVTLSNGEIYQIDNDKIKKLEKRIEILQKRLSKKVGPHKATKTKEKQLPSKRWLKQKQQIDKLHFEIKSIRNHFLHCTSKELVNNFSMIALEDLDIKQMTKSNKGTKDNPGENVKEKANFNRDMLRNSWGRFSSLVSYKGKWNNVEVKKVPPAFTSQRCNVCGFTDKDNRNKSVFKCLQCGYEENADVNGALNVLALAESSG